MTRSGTGTLFNFTECPGFACHKTSEDQAWPVLLCFSQGVAPGTGVPDPKTWRLGLKTLGADTTDC